MDKMPTNHLSYNVQQYVGVFFLCAMNMTIKIDIFCCHDSSVYIFFIVIISDPKKKKKSEQLNK